MIYTCYDMIQDCRADRPAGWSHFISHYVPVIRKIATHYYPGQAADGVLVVLRRPESSLFDSLDPAPERWFVAALRQRVLAALDSGAGNGTSVPDLAAGDLDLETISKALEPLTVLEKQAVWLETMRYTPERAGVLLRMDSGTVQKIREKAAERLRGALDNWSRSLLSDAGRPLGRAAAAAGQPACLPAKAFLDVLDGRTTWQGREELEGHVAACWHCIDHFCRLAEVLDLLRGLAPLPESEAAPLRAQLGIPSPAKKGWRRWLGAG